MKAILRWAFVVLVAWVVLERFARAWDHDYDAAAYTTTRMKAAPALPPK